MYFIQKKGSLLTAALLFLLSFGKAFSSETCEPLYNSSSRIETERMWGVSLFGDFIYWRAHEKGLSYAETSADQHKFLHLDHDFTPGFRVGMAFSPKFDHWTFCGDYLRLHGEDKASSTASAYALWRKSILLTTAQKANWHYDIDLGSLAIERAFYLGKALSFVPYLAIEGGSIEQNYLVQYEYDGGWVDTKSHSSSWLIGPKIGLKASYLFEHGLKIIGQANSAIFFQKSSVRLIEDDLNIVNDLSVNFHDKRTYSFPYLNLSLGLGWGKYFCNRTHVDISVAYDFLYFWNQNFMGWANKLNSTYYSDTKLGALSLDGITIHLQFDF